MTTKERQSSVLKKQLAQKSSKEKNMLIKMNQSLQGAAWDESSIPTLTSLADHKPITNEQTDFSFDIIEDFIPHPNTENGHQIDCSCIKCQPKRRYNSVSPLASIPIEKNIQPLSRKRFK